MQIHVARGQEQLGIFSPEDIRAKLATGELLPSDYGWTDGQKDWIPLGNFPGLSEATPAAAIPSMRSQPVAQAAAARMAVAPTALPPTSGKAIASLVFGILSFVLLPCLSPILAIVFGHMSKSEIKRSGGTIGGEGLALAGLIMGYIGLAFSLLVIPILAGIALPVFSSVQVKALETRSLSQAKMIGTACRLYAVDNKGAYPKTLEELVPDYLPDAASLVCPISGPSVPVGYEYYGGMDNDPPDKVLLVSKALSKGKRRIVIYGDTSGRVVNDMPQLPPH